MIVRWRAARPERVGESGADAGLPGFFGKIASRRDFVARRIDAGTRSSLDEWLSAAMVASRRSLGPGWLQSYTTAPVWRFALPPGVAGSSALAGVLATSQDGSGRHFPLVVVVRLLPGASHLSLCRYAGAWFDAAEAAILTALSKETELEAFDGRVLELGALPDGEPMMGAARRLRFDGEAAQAEAYAEVLESTLAGTAPIEGGPPLTLWWTQDGGPAPASLLMHEGLPSPERFPALLDGQWARWGWDEPPPPRPAYAVPAAAAATLHGPLSSAARSHRGTRRSDNQDAALERADLGLWAVADGAGGHDAGAYASAAVIAKLGEFMPALSFTSALTEIEELLGEANDALQARGRQLGPERIVAAVVVTLFVHRGLYAVVWAGDSRAYLLRDGEVVRLTRDHVSEDARYVTRAIGATPALMLDVARGNVMAGDRFVLCSDGLVKATGAAAIDAALRRGTPSEAAAALIDDALIAGATDNVTALVVDVSSA